MITDDMLSRAFLLLGAALLSVTVQAGEVRLISKRGLHITAGFNDGSVEKSAIIIIHGFLQTREFSTVSRMANALSDSGYSVLTPTLSLGLSDRRQSLSCEAIHDHSLGQDADELAQWVDWLSHESNKPVILIGHSSGGATILKYLETYGLASVSHVILVSLSYADPGERTFESEEHASRARRVLASGQDRLDDYALSYCKSYPSLARDFLSYYEWDKQKISAAVQSYNGNISIVMGTGDTRVDSDWRQYLEKYSRNIFMIEGANHFFDEAHEFSLHDAVEGIIQNRAGG